MREIKFRAFNEKQGMCYPCELRRLNICMDFEGHVLFDNMADESLHWKLMQYTGLKDKNSVEIYEGDIVKWDDCSNGRHWRVAVVELSPALQFKCFDCPAIVNSSAHGHTFKFGSFIYTDTHNHLEIIGNIYENHELLK